MSMIYILISDIYLYHDQTKIDKTIVLHSSQSEYMIFTYYIGKFYHEIWYVRDTISLTLRSICTVLGNFSEIGAIGLQVEWDRLMENTCMHISIVFINLDGS